MNTVITYSCFIVSLLLCVGGYPTGAPPEACRQMIPGHGVPPQTGTNNPYKVMATETTFSCPGDTVTVIVTGNNFRGFLCQPVPNTGTLIQNPQDPVTKQNKCGKMASLTHTENSVKSGVSFIFKPQTTQSVNIVCTVVQAKLYFWTNISSPTLKYVKGRCQPKPETTEQSRSDVEQPGTGVINTADVRKENVQDSVNIPDSRVDQMPDTKLDNQLDRDGKGMDVGTGIDPTDNTESDGRNAGQLPSVMTIFVLSLVFCVLLL